MSESQRPPASLESLRFYDKSLAEWHAWLTGVHETVVGAGPLKRPNRYGQTGGDCAYWAIACELIDVAAVGRSDDPEAEMLHLMRMALEDAPDLAVMVDECWDRLPAALLEKLGDREDVRFLIDLGGME